MYVVSMINYLLLGFFLPFTIPFIVRFSWITERIFVDAAPSLDHFGFESHLSLSHEMNGIRCPTSVPWIRVTKTLELAPVHRLQRPEYVSI
jgi:hypothetical protein